MDSTNVKLSRKQEINGLMEEFAHGQEELRSIPSRHRNMKKLEMSKSRSSSQSSTYSPVVFSLDNAATSTPPGPATASSTSKVKKPLPLPSKDWSPMDDGIIVSLPGSTDVPPTRIDVDEHINGVLYGPPTRKRLPMFRDLCPE